MRRPSAFLCLATLSVSFAGALPHSAFAWERESGSASLSDWARQPRLLRFSVLGLAGLGITDFRSGSVPRLQVRSPEEAWGRRAFQPGFPSRAVGEPRGHAVLQIALQPSRLLGVVGGFRLGGFLGGEASATLGFASATPSSEQLMLGVELGLRQAFGGVSFQELFTWDEGTRLAWGPETVTQSSFAARVLSRAAGPVELGVEYSRYFGVSSSQDPRWGGSREWDGHGGALILGLSL